MKINLNQKSRCFFFILLSKYEIIRAFEIKRKSFASSEPCLLNSMKKLKTTVSGGGFKKTDRKISVLASSSLHLFLDRSNHFEGLGEDEGSFKLPQ